MEFSAGEMTLLSELELKSENIDKSITDIRECTTSLEAGLQKGCEFESHSDLKKALDEYCEATCVSFVTNISVSLERYQSSHARDPSRLKMNPALEFVYMKYTCVNGGKVHPSQSKGIRKVSTRKCGCPVVLVVGATIDGQRLLVKESILEGHNHPIDLVFYRLKHLDEETEREIYKLINSNGNKRLARILIRDRLTLEIGQHVSHKDLTGLEYRLNKRYGQVNETIAIRNEQSIENVEDEESDSRFDDTADMEDEDSLGGTDDIVSNASSNPTDSTPQDDQSTQGKGSPFNTTMTGSNLNINISTLFTNSTTSSRKTFTSKLQNNPHEAVSESCFNDNLTLHSDKNSNAQMLATTAIKSPHKTRGKMRKEDVTKDCSLSLDRFYNMGTAISGVSSIQANVKRLTDKGTFFPKGLSSSPGSGVVKRKAEVCSATSGDLRTLERKRKLEIRERKVSIQEELLAIEKQKLTLIPIQKELLTLEKRKMILLEDMSRKLDILLQHQEKNS